jgi:hypothetical protein
MPCRAGRTAESGAPVKWIGFLIAVMLGSWPALAQAGVERFAVVVGNNLGDAEDGPLHYAESDAGRVYDVLRELGGFQPANMVLLRDESADTLRRTLITVNERVRAAVAVPNTQAMLVVYYSGHADEDDLHLGSSRLSIMEFAQLARGSAASFRLVVLDACRSGALTRVKGGRVKAPFALPDESSPGDGVAFLTASAVSEDAQESDALRGSFFTHAFVTGLLGAADHDGDGRIVLDEAYRYAYQNTLRATSRTRSGIQHPTFRYDLRGQGEIVLTRPEAYAAQRASLTFPSGLTFLLMRENADGAVVAELSERAATRSLSLRSGRYFVRARARDVLYEGSLDAAAGVATTVALDNLDRIEYAQLVRKGHGGVRRRSQAFELGTRVRSTLPNAETPCFGGFAGYGIDFSEFGARARLGMCTSGFDNGGVHATTLAYDLDVRVYRAWDLGPFAVALGLGGGTTFFRQHFELAGEAPDRNSLVPFVSIGASTALSLTNGFYLDIDVAGETHFLAIEKSVALPVEHSAMFAIRTSLSVGKYF